MKNFFNLYWWQNRLKYLPLIQRVFLFFSLSKQFPSALNIEATNACNFNCSFCPRNLAGRKIGFISGKLYQKIIDEIAREGGVQVLWLMKDGESLMHPQIDKMVAYAKEKKAAQRIEIYTNGSFLDEAMGRKLIKAGLDVLTVSLDAVTKEEFRKMKGKDAYQKVVENTKNFLKLKRKLRTKKPFLTLKMIDMGKKSQQEKFGQMWADMADDVIIQKLHSWEGSIRIKNLEFRIKNSARYPCNLPWINPAIFWEGRVVPCCVNFRENELVMGDLNRQSLKEVWQGKKLKKLRQAHLALDFSHFPTCARCQFWQQLPDMSFWLRRIGV